MLLKQRECFPEGTLSEAGDIDGFQPKKLFKVDEPSRHEEETDAESTASSITLCSEDTVSLSEVENSFDCNAEDMGCFTQQKKEVYLSPMSFVERNIRDDV